MEPKELLTKRRIEKLAAEYEGWDEPESRAPKDGRKYDVFLIPVGIRHSYVRFFCS